MATDCFICAKHERLEDMPGGAWIADDLVLVSHLPPDTPGGAQVSAYLGYLFVEPRRHVRELGDLTPAEAAAFGRAAASASAALQAITDADHIYAAVIGHGVEHLHLHLIPRYRETPRAYWWTRLDEWPDAPRGDATDITSLAEQFRAALR